MIDLTKIVDDESAQEALRTWAAKTQDRYCVIEKDWPSKIDYTVRLVIRAAGKGTSIAEAARAALKAAGEGE